MPFAANSATQIHYEVSGAGAETVLLVPGLGLGGAALAQVAAILQDRCRTVVIEPRGSGDSDGPDEEYTEEVMAGDVRAVLDDASLDQVHVFGVSMGGLIAQDFAARHPGRVRSLTLLSTYAVPDEWFTRLMGLRRDMVRRDGVVEQLKLSILSISSPFAFREIPDALRAVERTLQESPPPQHAYLRQMDYCLQDSDRADRSSRLDVPTVVVTGSHDFLTPVTLGRDLAALIPSARYVEIEHASHCLFLEQPATVAELIGDLVLQATPTDEVGPDAGRHD